MATEPTMGGRILDAAEAYDRAASALRGRTTFPQEANASANAALADLRALCARADAAERGMVAFAEDVTGDNWHRVVAERTEALAAWRAMGENQP